jgi:hypothetical protein
VAVDIFANKEFGPDLESGTNSPERGIHPRWKMLSFNSVRRRINLGLVHQAVVLFRLRLDDKWRNVR